MGNQQPAFAVELAEVAEVARQRPLAIYAGAGLAQPISLGGAEIARQGLEFLLREQQSGEKTMKSNH